MGKPQYSRKPDREKKIALERIDSLFSLASDSFAARPDLSDKYVGLARRIAMRLKVRIRPELKRRFCKHCHAYILPGKNVRVRLTAGHVTYYCLSCKKFMRFPHIKKRVKKRVERSG